MIFLIKFDWQSFQMAPNCQNSGRIIFLKQAELLLLSLTLLHSFRSSRAEHYSILIKEVLLYSQLHYRYL